MQTVLRSGGFAASENALFAFLKRLAKRRSFRERRNKCAPAVSYWLGLILGTATVAWGQASGPVSTQPAQPTPPVTTAPSDTRTSTTAVSLQQLDEYLRLVTGKNEPDVRLMGARRLLEAGRDAGQLNLISDRLMGVLTAETPDLAAQLAVCQAIVEASSPPPSLIEPLLSLLGDARPGLDEAVTHALRRFESELVVCQILHSMPVAYRES